jgi:cellulose synthase/poly-beta-1,6-N-acetylglucosamine synthase-like glycosyltransferase
MEDTPFVSIVIPVRNEERILGRCLASIAGLEYPKDRFEVIVADSLSSDGSPRIAEQFGARIVPNPRRTVVSARNCGFAAARGEMVAFTDADCVLRRDWLKTGVEALRTEGVAGAGGLTLFPEEATAFQQAVNVLFLMASAAGATAHRQAAAPVRFVSDLPGCNSIYRRAALAQVMPVDESLLTAEDVWMNWLLRERGFRHVAADGMVVWHHRRSTLKSFCRQMYRYAIGRLQVGRREHGLISPIHLAAGFSLPAFAAITAGSLAFGRPEIPAALVVLGTAAGFAIGLAKTRSPGAACCVPVALAAFLTAWSLGFLRELAFPLKSVDGK